MLPKPTLYHFTYSYFVDHATAGTSFSEPHKGFILNVELYKTFTNCEQFINLVILHFQQKVCSFTDKL